MTRRTAKLAAIYLLLGLVATILGVLLPQFLGTRTPMFPGASSASVGPTPWPISVPDHWPPEADRRTTLHWLGHDAAYTWLAREGESIAIGSPGQPAVEQLGTDLFQITTQRYGWPWSATQLISAYEHRVSNGAYVLDAPGPEGLRGGLHIPGLGWLAAYPVWPGLLADTLFYILLFSTLHQLAAWGRRTHRRRRGRCAVCGYDLSGIHSLTCPECGHKP